MIDTTQMIALTFLLTALVVIILVMMGFSLSKIENKFEKIDTNLTKIVKELKQKRG